MLQGLAALMVLSSLTFASTHVVWLLFAAALMGALISTSVGGGAFLALEQAILAQNVVDARRTLLFVFYSLVGSLSAAFGGLFSGVAGRVFPGDQAEMAYKTLFLLAALLGAIGSFTGIFAPTNLRRYIVFPRDVLILLTIVCISLVLTGAGAFAFDLPL